MIREDYEKQYKELSWVSTQIKDLGGKCRIFHLSETNLSKISNFQPSGIFWKGTRLIDHSKLVFKIVKLGLPQIPSFAASFIAGDKAFLANLKEKDTTGAIPSTYLLSKDDPTKNFGLLAKDKVVLKPSDLSQGEGIKFGKNFDKKTWKAEIQAATNSPEEWVIQELCYLKKAKNGKYQDLAVFLADGLTRGVASRISTNEVVNISLGGLWQAVVLSDEEENKESKKTDSKVREEKIEQIEELQIAQIEATK